MRSSTTEDVAPLQQTDSRVAQQTLTFIAQRHGSLLLHAGGVARADGRSVVIHGESGAGKTTLTAALVSARLAYITDETVCIDPQTMEIEPFRKPLTVKSGSHEVLAALRPSKKHISEGSGNWQIPPETLNGPELPEVPMRPAVIVFPDYDAEHGEVEVAPVSRARAAFVLGEQSSAMWAIEPRPLAAVARLVNAAPAYQVSYSNAFAAAPVIVRDLLPAASSAPADEVSDVKQAAPTGSNGPRRAEGVDWFLLDSEAVLFDGEHLHHLDPPGAAIWQALDGKQTLEQVAVELADAFQADAKQVLLDVEDLVRVFRGRKLVS